MSEETQDPWPAGSIAALAEFVSGLRQFIYVSGADWKIHYASEAYATIWGRSLRSLHENPRSWFEAIHPDDTEGMAEILRTMPTDEYALDYRVIRPDGTVRWVRDRGFWTAGSPGDTRKAIGIVEDITDRKQSEYEDRSTVMQALRRHEIEQQALLDLIPALVWIKDPENRIARINRAAAASIGMAVGDVEGRSTYELYPEEAGKYHRDDLDVMRTGKPKLGIIEQLTTASGEKRWVQTDKVPYFDDDGNAIGVVVFAQDVTDRKREEEWLQSLARGLRSIIEMADELIMCPEMDLFYRRAVELARAKLHVERCAIFHFDQRVARGTYGTNLDGVTTDERANSFEIMEEWEEHFATIRPEKSRWVVKDEADRWNWDGAASHVFGRGWVSYTAIARPGRRAMALFIHDAAITNGPFDSLKQELVAVYCSMLAQIIEQKRFEEVLRESEKKFRSLADTIEASIFLFQGNRMIYANPAAARISGYPVGELLEMNFWDVVHPDFQDLVRQRGAARQRGARVPSRYEVMIRTKQGEDRWIQYASRKIAFGGVPAVLGVGFDITVRKKAEQDLRSRIAFERLISRMSADLSQATGRSAAACIRQALGQLAKYLGVQNICLSMYSDDLASMTEVYEYRTRGAPALTPLLRDAPLARFGELSATVLSGKNIVLEDTSKVPPSVASARNISRRMRHGAVLVVPVTARGRVCGALSAGHGKGPRAWLPSDIALLKLAAEMMGGALYREHLEEEHTRLANKIMLLQEQERRDLSGVLHDEIGQVLTLTSMELRAPGGSSGKVVRRAARRLDGALKTVRNLAASLRPPILDDLGVASGLKSLCAEFNRRAGMQVTYSGPASTPSVPDTVSTCLYRVLQEALTNAARHARAKRVAVAFRVAAREAVLEVKDDGRGFNVSAVSRRRGVGLIGMKERVASCAGALDIRSGPGEGTRIRARLSWKKRRGRAL